MSKRLGILIMYFRSIHFIKVYYVDVTICKRFHWQCLLRPVQHLLKPHHRNRGSQWQGAWTTWLVHQSSELSPSHSSPLLSNMKGIWSTWRQEEGGLVGTGGKSAPRDWASFCFGLVHTWPFGFYPLLVCCGAIVAAQFTSPFFQLCLSLVCLSYCLALALVSKEQRPLGNPAVSTSWSPVRALSALTLELSLAAPWLACLLSAEQFLYLAYEG